MHRLLLRQIKRHFGKAEDLPVEIAPLLGEVSTFYYQADDDRAMIERSLEIASQEMLEQNRALTAELDARRVAESQVTRLINFDELTGLAKRNLLMDRLTQAIAGAQRQMQKVTVIVLGLDHFKTIDDSLGHCVGNDLLKIIGGRLSACIRDSDTVARLGGDEFAIVLTGSQEVGSNPNRSSAVLGDEIDAHLIELLQRLLKSVSDTVVLADRDLQVTCSIGVSQFPQDGDDSEVLLRAAGAAMGNAKQTGRNKFQFFKPEQSAKIEARLAMQGHLRLAIERQEFVLHFQPQVDLHSGCVVGVEALIRWNHPELGLVTPMNFIGVAEETGLIVPIGAWVIRAACEQSMAWRREGRGKIRMAVNLSVRQFAQPDLVEYIASVLAETALEPECLEIELTESLVMDDVEQSVGILHRLKTLGLQMSIDDFGTGYSSLAYLTRLPIDLLKIDQSFVRESDSADGVAIIKAIISMAHSLGIRVIAEGVETEAQCDLLRLNNCDEIQGYLFSKPMEAEKIGVLLMENKRLPDKLLRIDKPKRTLLLVDDEPNTTSALKRIFRHTDLQILTANSGPAGLDVLANHPVDVIVSDQQMPGLSGIEFLKTVKDLYPDTIRIEMSAATQLHSVTETVNEGVAYKCLNKPWNEDELRNSIEEAFRRKEFADENLRLNFEMQTSNQKLAEVNRKLSELLRLKEQQLTDELSNHPHGSRN